MERRGITVTQQRPVAGRQDRGQPPALPTQLSVPDGEDAAVEAQQSAAAQPVAHHRLGDAPSGELPPRHDAVLSGGERRFDLM